MKIDESIYHAEKALDLLTDDEKIADVLLMISFLKGRPIDESLGYLAGMMIELTGSREDAIATYVTACEFMHSSKDDPRVKHAVMTMKKLGYAKKV